MSDELTWADARAWVDGMGGRFHAKATLVVHAGERGELVVTARAWERDIALELDDGSDPSVVLGAGERRTFEVFAREGQERPAGELVFEARLGATTRTTTARIQRVD